MDNVNLDSLFDDVTTEQETPAEQETESATTEPETTEETPAEEKPALTVQERAGQAEGRRIREREARAYQAARERDSEIIKTLGLTHPETNKAIETMEDLEAYAAEMRTQRMAAGQGTESDVRSVVQEELRSMRPPVPQQPRLSSEEVAQMNKELAEIRAMDPAITDVGSILNSEAGPKFREYVGKGLSFVDAYTLAAKDRLASLQSNRAAAKAGSKSHLNATKQQGTGALSVPRDQMDLFRALNPGVSDADIQKFYNADKKQFG